MPQIRPGCRIVARISPGASDEEGTVGPVVRRRATGRRYVITAYHVVEHAAPGGVYVPRADNAAASRWHLAWRTDSDFDQTLDLALLGVPDGHPIGAAPLEWEKTPRLLGAHWLRENLRVATRGASSGEWALGVVTRSVEDHRFLFDIAQSAHPSEWPIPLKRTVKRLEGGDSGAPVYGLAGGRLFLAGIVVRANAVGGVEAVHPGVALARFEAELEGVS